MSHVIIPSSSSMWADMIQNDINEIVYDIKTNGVAIYPRIEYKVCLIDNSYIRKYRITQCERILKSQNYVVNIGNIENDSNNKKYLIISCPVDVMEQNVIFSHQ